jgi:hypothetical protein
VRTTKPAQGYCHEHAATADLSDGKHEDFGRSSGTPGQPKCVPHLALTIFSVIFSIRGPCDALEADRDATVIRLASRNFPQGQFQATFSWGNWTNPR